MPPQVATMLHFRPDMKNIKETDDLLYFSYKITYNITKNKKDGTGMYAASYKLKKKKTLDTDNMFIFETDDILYKECE